MNNIKHEINGNNDELSSYNGLLGAIIYQAVKDFQASYVKLIKVRNLTNYNEFIINRLFFINSCNGYCEQNLSNYILEKAIKIVDESYSKKEIDLVKSYIKNKDEEFNNIKIN